MSEKSTIVEDNVDRCPPLLRWIKKGNRKELAIQHVPSERGLQYERQ